MVEPRGALAEPYDSMPQQLEAATLGMWTFLATEVLFFGGLFLAYVVYRYAYPHAFVMAGRRTLIRYGTLNTAILITSSLTMSMANYAVRKDNIKWLVRFLLLTLVLGLCFLGVKGAEYHADVREHLFPGRHFTTTLPTQGEIFWYLYWLLTGTHALHLAVGIGVLSVMTWMAWRRRFSAGYYSPVVISSLYWHFIDLLWLWLYALLYLINRH
jgi:cytochrome c oxidase subunit III